MLEIYTSGNIAAYLISFFVFVTLTLYRTGPIKILHYLFFKLDRNQIISALIFTSVFFAGFWYACKFAIDFAILYYNHEVYSVMFYGTDGSSYYFMSSDFSQKIVLPFFGVQGDSFNEIYREVNIIKSTLGEEQVERTSIFMPISIFAHIWPITVLFLAYIKFLENVVIDIYKFDEVSRDFSRPAPPTILSEIEDKAIIKLVASLIPLFFIYAYAEYNITDKLLDRGHPLPMTIAVGEHIDAKPIAAHKIMDSYFNKNGKHETRKTYDTGYRSVLFKFEEGFEAPVYVTDHFYADKNPGYYEYVLLKIKENEAMSIKLDKNLRLVQSDQHEYHHDIKGINTLEIIDAYPVKQSIVYYKFVNDRDDIKRRDSGFRDVTFNNLKNNIGEPLTYRYHVLDKPGFRGLILAYIEASKPIKISIKVDGHISVITAPDSEKVPVEI